MSGPSRPDETEAYRPPRPAMVLEFLAAIGSLVKTVRILRPLGSNLLHGVNALVWSQELSGKIDFTYGWRARAEQEGKALREVEGEVVWSWIVSAESCPRTPSGSSRSIRTRCASTAPRYGGKDLAVYFANLIELSTDLPEAVTDAPWPLCTGRSDVELAGAQEDASRNSDGPEPSKEPRRRCEGSSGKRTRATSAPPGSWPDQVVCRGSWAFLEIGRVAVDPIKGHHIGALV